MKTFIKSALPGPAYLTGLNGPAGAERLSEAYSSQLTLSSEQHHKLGETTETAAEQP